MINNILNKKQIYLFDLDGTITEPKEGITKCVQYSLKFFYIEEPDLDKLECFIGPPLYKSYQVYYGMNEEIAGFHKEILYLADYTTPSYTEAAFLAGEDYTVEDVPAEKFFTVTESLKAMGASNVVMTSCLSDGQWCCTCYDRKAELKFILPYEFVDKKVGGTGDVFSALFMAEILNGTSFASAAEKAMGTVRQLIIYSIDDTDALRGVQLEKYLDKL